MNINEFVGSKIREYRKKKGLNQTELGKKLGVKQNTVAGYEKGEFEVSYDNLFKLTDIFEISIDDLFPETKTEENNLQKALELTRDKELNTEHMALINEITEKALTLEGSERDQLMNSIQLALDLYKKMNK
ncbi:helix-turn-helix domain-containing protein [Virgibacillus salexigens]|uniref:helix-turn-helix domain-containing protein n=1 Tax=Virgibacillus TaxID=84406 RepID=UPI001367D673|nr:helix-turn-helix domain-containing protein [Virgibacillus massiliensis]